MKLKKRKAFTLVEISVVIIIIAILIAGVVQAVEMFSEASLKSARNLSKLSRVSRIEDLTLWLDATSSEAFDKEKDDNSTVSVWKDTNASAGSIISSSSSLASLYPSYTLSAINKLPAVSFKKTSSLVGNCVTVPNGSFVNSFEDFTLYLIFSPKTLDDGIIIEKNNASATTFPFSLELLSGSYKFSVKNSADTISVIGSIKAKINTPNLIRLSRIKGSQIEIAIDGISSTETDTLTSSTLNNAELSIGCRNGSAPANFINGDIGETAFYNRNLNLKDKSDIEEYLYKKWKMRKFEGTLLTKTCNAPNANTIIDATSVNFTNIPISTTCKEGYSGSPTYTCTGTGNLGTYNAGGTPCTAISCTAPASNGYLAQSSLAYKTAVSPGTITCDQAGYSGSVSYTCTASGPATVTGSCTAITCTAPASNGYLSKTGLAYKTAVSPGTITCDQVGYSGSVSYTCTSTGQASVTGICTANTCSLPQGTGYSAKTLLPIGSSSFSCDVGYAGTINYTCPPSGGTISGTGSCTAITCNVPSTVNANEATVGFSTTPSITGLSCKTGFTGSPNYTCTGTTSTGTYTAGGTPCIADVITCNVPSSVNASQATVVSSSTITATGLTCKAGFFGSPKYTCTGASTPGTYTADGIPCAPIKCYANDMIGLRGTNYFDNVYTASFETMEAWSSLFRISSSDPNLSLVNRLKLHDIYHGPLNYTDSSTATILNFNPIDRSNFSKTSYPSFFRYRGAPYDTYNIMGNHVLTKYARVLDYGNNAFTCDSGFSGNPTYNCSVDGSILNPTSGTCVANTCTVSAGTGYNQQSKTGSGTFSCDVAGYNGTISYSCTTNGGTVAGSGTCYPSTCLVPTTTNSTIDGTTVNYTTTATPLTCKEGLYGYRKYTCTGTFNVTGFPCSPIKCYAKERVGLSGTNYFDNVYTASFETMVAWPSFFRITSSDPNLSSVNRLKLHDVYHGPINYTSSSSGTVLNFTSIDRTYIPTTSYPSFFRYRGAPYDTYNIMGNHVLTKYARILDYGTNIIVNCDSGFTGTLTYNCTVDGSTLDPISGTCN